MMNQFLFHVAFVAVLNRKVCGAFETNFFLFTRKNANPITQVNTPFGGFRITPENINEASSFDFTLKTYFAVHGFTSSANTSWITTIREKILLSENANFIAVDWTEGAKFDFTAIYTQAAVNTRLVGEKIAQFLIDANIDPKMVHCMGHSLGAYGCSYAGKVAKLGRLTALDPAAPLFNDFNTIDDKLGKSDAYFVDVIHTSVYGIQFPVGHQGKKKKTFLDEESYYILFHVN